VDNLDTEKLRGGCLCGSVRFYINAGSRVRDIWVCHCTQCRKLSGYLYGATATALKNFFLESDSSLTWYRSSDFAKRGFCNKCGSLLLYLADNKEIISISAGALDQPTGLTVGMHIFTENCPDFYSIPDDNAIKYTYFPEHLTDKF